MLAKVHYPLDNKSHTFFVKHYVLSVLVYKVVQSINQSIIYYQGITIVGHFLSISQS